MPWRTKARRNGNALHDDDLKRKTTTAESSATTPCPRGSGERIQGASAQTSLPRTDPFPSREETVGYSTTLHPGNFLSPHRPRPAQRDIDFTIDATTSFTVGSSLVTCSVGATAGWIPRNYDILQFDSCNPGSLIPWRGFSYRRCSAFRSQHGRSLLRRAGGNTP